MRKQEWVKVSLLAGRLSDFSVSITCWEKLVHLSVGLGFNSISCQPNTDWRWTGRGSASAQRLAIGFLLQHSPPRHSLHAHSPTSFSSLPFLPYPFITDSQREAAAAATAALLVTNQGLQWAHPFLLAASQLPWLPGYRCCCLFFLSLSLSLSHTHTHTHRLTHTYAQHTLTHSLMLDPSKHLVHFYTCMWTLLHHSWPFSCVWLLLPFFVLLLLLLLFLI